MTATADADNAAYVDVSDGAPLYDAAGNVIPHEYADAAGRALKADYDAVKSELVSVGDINYTVIDKSGNKVASGTMTADAAKPGQYADNPYDANGAGSTFVIGTDDLPNGEYTIILAPTGGDYALKPTSKTFTVGNGGNTGGGTGGGGTVTPVLEKKDHFAFMQGDQTGAFRPDDSLTRAEAAQIFYNLLVDKTAGSTKVSFPDVASDAWYAKAVNTLASYGIINGLPDGTFGPDKLISRAEFATIACRFDKLTDGKASFSDVDESYWAYKYIAFAAEKGWVTGYTDGTFRPANNIARCEVVALVCRVLDRNPDKTYIDKHTADLRLFPDVAASHWAYYYIAEATNGHNYTKDSKGVETWSGLK